MTEKEILAANMRRQLKLHHMSRADLAKRIGVAYTTLNDWYKAKTYPRMDKVEAMASAFGINKSDLIEAAAPPDPNLKVACSTKFRAVPNYDPLSCGPGGWIDEIPSDYLALPESMLSRREEYFSNPACGDSMLPGIKNGDFLIFQEAQEIPSGKIGSFVLNGEYYCKRFKRLSNGSVWLMSDNPDYDPIPIGPEDDFKTLGLYKYKLSKEQ